MINRLDSANAATISNVQILYNQNPIFEKSKRQRALDRPRDLNTYRTGSVEVSYEIHIKGVIKYQSHPFGIFIASYLPVWICELNTSFEIIANGITGPARRQEFL